MNKICRIYISEIRTLFPIKRKSERKYLKNLASDIDAFCEEANITTKQELYQKYGTPPEVVCSYFSSLNTEQIVQKLRVSKAIKVTLVCLIILATIATTAYCIHLHNIFESFKRSEIAISDEAIVVEEIIGDEYIDQGTNDEVIIEEEIIVEEIIEE